MIDLRTIPFTYPWILQKAIGNNVKTVLDIGCGDGELMRSLGKDQKWEITGVDVFKPSIQSAKKTGAYKKLYVSDILNLPIEITSKKYDVVFSSQVVEHLKKKEALALIKQMEKLANKKVVITTTVGFMHFLPLNEVHHHEHDGNPFQEHKSSWDPKEFERMDYSSHGQGLFIIYREGFLAHKLPLFIHPVLYAISLLFSPLVYFVPQLGTYQINSKKVK